MLVRRDSAVRYRWVCLFQAAFFLAIFAVCLIGIPTSAYASSALSKGHREALKRGCVIKVRDGEYKSKAECRRNEKLKIISQRELANLNDLTKSQKKKFQLACLKAKSAGILAYDNCLHAAMACLKAKSAGILAHDKCIHAEFAKLDPREERSKPTPPSPPIETPTEYGGVKKLSTSTLVAQLDKGTVLVLTQKTTGSGFFIAPGLIITNRHVIEGAHEKVYITSRAIGRIRMAKIVARSRGTGQRDFALLSVGKDLGRDFFFPINPAPAKLDSVIASGYPGLIVRNDESFRRLMDGDASAAPDLVLSKGEISANQTTADGVDTLAHTAQIMGGNSGGPLVDACGRVVGINTFIREQPGKAGLAGFALSSQEVLDFLDSHKVTVKVDMRTCVD